MRAPVVVLVGMAGLVGLALTTLDGGEAPPPRAEPLPPSVAGPRPPEVIERVALASVAEEVVPIPPMSEEEPPPTVPVDQVDYDALVRSLVSRDAFIAALVEHVHARRPEDYDVSPQLGAEVYECVVDFAAREYRLQDLILAAEAAGEEVKDMAFLASRRALIAALPGLVDAIRTDAVLVGVSRSVVFGADWATAELNDRRHWIRLAFRWRGWRVSLELGEGALSAEDWAKVVDDVRRERADEDRRRALRGR